MNTMAMQSCGEVVVNMSCEYLLAMPRNRIVQLNSQKINVDKILHVHIMLTICLIGIAGNCFFFVLLRLDRKKREALILMRALAVADTMYLVTALLRYPLRFLVDSHLYEHMQLYVFPLLKMCQTITIWMMVLVTIDRYIYVSKPLQANMALKDAYCKRRLLAVCVFLAAAVYNIPRFIDSCVTKFTILCLQTSYSRVHYLPAFNNWWYYSLYIDAAYVLFLYVVPLLILCYLNARLVQGIRTPLHRRSSITHHSRLASENSATLVLVIIVVVFVVCQTPELIYHTLTAAERHLPNVKIHMADLVSFSWAIEVLMVVNSSVNFFVYFLFGSGRRLILKRNLSSLTLRGSSHDTQLLVRPVTRHQEMDVTTIRGLAKKTNNGYVCTQGKQ